ncbi:hypothetical protein MML48_3g00018154 [Holotrichia oblita]|uniref:Uncharacterized protein n=1 Tax=Holotrichia oblita TaxID=644536 RepID=A0ACB9TGD6_HOLOL|nr:hypothetical protein MML48_3g00018154 [Holotrichia oblita]
MSATDMPDICLRSVGHPMDIQWTSICQKHGFKTDIRTDVLWTSYGRFMDICYKHGSIGRSLTDVRWIFSNGRPMDVRFTSMDVRTTFGHKMDIHRTSGAIWVIIMVFTAEHDAFILNAHYSGTRDDGDDGNWNYSLQSYIEQFSEAFPDFHVDYDALKYRRHVVIHRFEQRQKKSSDRPTKLTEHVLDDIRERMDRSPQKSVPKLANQTDELPQLIEPDEDVKVIRARGSWGEMVVDYTFYCGNAEHNLYSYLYKISDYVIDKINKGFKKHKSIRIQLVTVIQYEEYDLSGNVIDLWKRHFSSKIHTIMDKSIVKSVLTQMKNAIIRNFEGFNEKNTMIRFDRLLNVDLQSKSIRNPVKDHTDRPSRYDISKYECLNMKYPLEVTSENISKYEEFLNTSINIYKVLDDRVDLFILSENIGKTKKHVNISEYDEHCVGIKNLSALLSGQIHKRDKHMNICLKCHDKFENKQKFEEHIDLIRSEVHIKISFREVDSFEQCEEELLIKIIFQPEYYYDTCYITAMNTNQLVETLDLLYQAREARNIPPDSPESGSSSSSTSDSNIEAGGFLLTEQ